MSFSLWPSSSGAAAAGNAISTVTSRKTQPSSPALDFIQVLHSSGLEVSYYGDLVKDPFFDTSAPVGSGGQAVVELSRRPGVVIKRTRRFEYGDGNHVHRADENLARVMLEIRILTDPYLRSSDLDEELHQRTLRVFHASLQDDPLQRQPMLEIWKALLPPTHKDRLDQFLTAR